VTDFFSLPVLLVGEREFRSPANFRKFRPRKKTLGDGGLVGKCRQVRNSMT
jgi:hypothetical protein